MKRAFRTCLALVLAALSLFVLAAPALAASSTVTINVYNWGDYIDLDVLDMFEEKYPNIKVNYTTFDSNEGMYAKILSGAASYDVVVPSDYMISKMIQEGLLAELNFDNIPNMANINDSFRNLFYDPEGKYSVPYTWGTVAIIYNTKYIDPADVEEQSLSILWNEKYKGKILMFDNPRDTFGIALKALGYSMNSGSRKEWEEARDLLGKQKPLVQAYVMDAIFDKMEAEEAWIAPYYAGDALLIQDENEYVDYFFPKEGTNMFVDAMCVMEASEHKAEAETFINFCLEPDIGALIAEAIGYASPNDACLPLLDEEMTESELLYPSKEFLDANTEVFANLSTEIQILESNLWTGLKIESAEEGEEGGPALNGIDIFCIVILALCAAGMIHYAISSRRKKKLWTPER